MAFIKYIVHFLLLLFVAHITYLCKPGTSLFSFHPFLMTFGYGFLMTESLLSYTPFSLFGNNTLKSRVYYHWLLNAIAGGAIILGFLAIYINKEWNNANHFVSYHGLFGGISVAYSLTQMTAGIFAKYPHVLKKCIKVRPLKMMHSASGMASYTISIIALLLAFYSNWMNLNMPLGFQALYTLLFISVLLYIFKGVYMKVSSFLSS